MLFALVLMAMSSMHADISRGNQEWIDGMKARDPELMARAYATDAVFCTPKGECLNGHDAIVKFFAARVAAMKSNVADAHVTSKQTVVDGDLAYEWGTAEVTYADGTHFGGKYVTVWRHDADGHWRIVRNMAM